MEWPKEIKHLIWSKMGQVRKDLCDEPYLPKVNWDRAFLATPFDKLRAVILGQDPYPTPGYANGLAFSTDKTPLPASLKNIFAEYVNDLGFPYPSSGDLSPWAEKGVLLLNTALTVSPYNPGSHTHLWRELTENVLKYIDERKSGIVFVLWGKQAQSFLPSILPSLDQQRHHFVLSAHPSPLSAHRGFFGSRPFSKVNSFLNEPIDWRLP